MYREATLNSLPEIECIVSSISNLSEVDEIEVFTNETGRRVKFTGFGEPGHVYDIRYSGSLVSAQVLIFDEIYKSNRTISYRHNLGSSPEILNQETIDIERKIALRIEASIAEHCGVTEILNSKEYCRGVKCN